MKASLPRSQRPVRGRKPTPMPRNLLQVPLKEIFEWALGDKDAGREPNYPVISKYAEALLPEFEHQMVGYATRSRCDAYIDRRQKIVSAHTKAEISYRSAKSEIDTLLTMIRRFATAHGIKDTLATRYERIPVAEVDRTLSRNEIVRLLQACIGKRWSRERKAMVRWTGIKPKRIHLATARQHMARYILMAVLLGTTDGLMRRLKWAPAAKGKAPHSWVDLETRELHRLGPDKPTMSAYHDVPVRIPRFLTWCMRKWRAHDLKHGLPYVLGVDHEMSLRFDAFRVIAHDANLFDVTPATLVDTFAANAMRGAGTSVFGLAIVLGRESRRVKAKYQHFRKDHQEEAIAATRQRPASLNHPSPTSAAPTRTKGRKRRVSDGRAA